MPERAEWIVTCNIGRQSRAADSRLVYRKAKHSGESVAVPEATTREQRRRSTIHAHIGSLLVTVTYRLPRRVQNIYETLDSLDPIRTLLLRDNRKQGSAGKAVELSSSRYERKCQGKHGSTDRNWWYCCVLAYKVTGSIRVSCTGNRSRKGRRHLVRSTFERH
jgi:hypothetical protein